MSINKYLQLSTIVVLIAVFFGAQFFAAEAQAGPQIMLTWSAESYAPPTYQGKIFPTAGSPITVSIEIIDNGRPANLAGKTTYWYLNNNLIESRPGTKTVRFNAPERVAAVAAVRVEIPDYPDGLILRTINIPVVSPQAIIEAPYPDKTFSGAQIRALGSPYFFNAQSDSNFVFSWSVSGQTPESSERPQELIVNVDPLTPAGTMVNLALSIINARNQSEDGSNFLILRKQ